MSWLRLDDVYDTNTKILRLTEQQAWRWTRVLLYCAKHETKGRIDVAALKAVGIHGKHLEAVVAAGLAHPVDDRTYAVNDWAIYNGSTVEEKVACVLERDPEATANEVHRIIGGKREMVMAEVARQKEAAPKPVPNQFPGTAGSVPLARACEPDPIPLSTHSPSFLQRPASDGTEGRIEELTANLLRDAS